jgi:hypothetical protein
VHDRQESRSLTVLTEAEGQLPQPAETGPVLENRHGVFRENQFGGYGSPLLAIEGPNDAALSFAELDSCVYSPDIFGTKISHQSRWDCLTRHRGSRGNGRDLSQGIPVFRWIPIPAPLAREQVGLRRKHLLCDSITAPLFASLRCKLIILDQKWDTITATARGEVPPVPAPETAALLTGTEWDEPPAVRTLTSQVLVEACQKRSIMGLQPGDRIPS